MAKRARNLKDIKVNEVSLVDMPANKSPFLFFKRQGDQQIIPMNKQKKIKINIESDGTVGGTSVSVNGSTLKKLKSFDFGFYGDDPKQAIHAAYSIITNKEGGFSRTESYRLTKGDKTMNEQLLKALQKYLGTEDIDFKKGIDEETIEKAISLITSEYQESFPQDLEEAVGVLAKRASESFNKSDTDDNDVEKAGAKFSRDALSKLKAIISAVESLKAMLPNSKEPTQKSADTDDEISELGKKVTQLSEAIAKLGKKDNSEDESSISKLSETLENLSKRLEAIEKDGATRKSIEGDDTDDDTPSRAGEDGKPLWPTLTNQGKH